VPELAKERAPGDQQARKRGSGTGRESLHGGIMTDVSRGAMSSVMRYSSTGWFGSSWSL
jgi:hypothetical protein